MICTDLHSCLSPILVKYDPSQVVVVRDSKVELSPSVSALFSAHLVLETDESRKGIESVERIWDFLLEHHVTRSGVLVAVGGGVLTDMAGFAAATYKRGIAYVNVPTTLLAMVDASTGGKTGFNYGGLKNSIGAFCQPVATVIYPPFLKTLPPHEFLSGFAEMLKTGLLESEGTTPRLWDRLLQYDLDQVESDEGLSPLIASCIAVKERIVAADPTEKGLRKALNLGHTFGHALEEIQMVNGQWSNGKWLHGYAVLYGMIAELYLSVVKLGCPKEPLQQLTQLMLHYYGRPQCKCSDREALISLMQQDKKNERAAEINCTLLQEIGSPRTNQVITTDEANEALEYLFAL